MFRLYTIESINLDYIILVVVDNICYCILDFPAVANIFVHKDSFNFDEERGLDYF